MKTLTRFLALFAFTGAAFAQQNTLTQTSLSAAITATAQTFSIASATNVTAASALYIDGEFMPVISITGTAVTVQRGASGTKAVAHVNAAMVLAGSPSLFYGNPPAGACTTATTLVTPYVDYKVGAEYLCSTVTLSWVAGWQNDLLPPQVTTAVASAAGLVTPSGPLFHITGALAITGFNVPLGFAYGSFTVIPDGAFTTTTANNIAIASTGVVSKPLTFTFDNVTGKFYPSY